MTVGQRLAVAISCICFILLINSDSKDSFGSIVLLFVLAVMACVEKTCSIANSVSVEKDWVRA